jgi:hypothetical protein
VSTQGTSPMFLCVTVFAFTNESHISKIAVPEKTKVKENFSPKDNNLDYLVCNKDGSKDIFDPATRCNYLEISSDECQAQLKE